MLRLEFPAEKHRKQWYEIIRDFERNNEKITPYALKLNTEDFDEYLKKVTAMTEENPNQHIPELKYPYVPASTYFLVDDSNNKILGATNIRHKLNDYLLTVGGNIGYGVAPSERRKGYAMKMLTLALEKCRKLKIEKALVTCNKTNIGSAKTIIYNGGVKENEYVEDSGNIVERYWINTDVKFSRAGEGSFDECVDVIRESFATVADEFNITEQNCPTYVAFTQKERLEQDFKQGKMMFSLSSYSDGKIIGFMQLHKDENDESKYYLEKICVSPQYRQVGYGKRLLDSANEIVRINGGSKIYIGIIEENTRLKNWYTKNGFTHTGTKIFPHLPFTVGFMEKEIIR